MTGDRTRAAARVAALAGSAVLAAGLVACGGQAGGGGGGGGGGEEEELVVGLITKTESNPFFVKMKEGAQAEATKVKAELITAAGKADNDNQGQVTAMENMTSRGAKGILITPADSKAIVPAIKKARDAGVLVIALDTPTEPQDAADALFATDNKKAGVLIGQYAKAKVEAENVSDPKIAMLDLAPGISVGQLRHDGFLEGFGIEEGASEIVGAADTLGETAKGQTAMETLLQKDPEINIVYSINEPSGFGGATALKAAGTKPDDVIVTSVDGGCDAIEKGIKTGTIDATSQQYPLKMAQLGVQAVAEFAKSGKKPSGYVDTGVTLITDDPVEGVPSKDSKFGTENCWG